MKAVWNGAVLADSDDIVVVEGNAYFPASSLDTAVISDSSYTSVCGWKGTAKYYSLNVGGQVNKDAVWYYPEPKSGALQVKDRVAFWKGVKVE